MSQEQIDSLNTRLVQINEQLREIADSLSDVAKRSNGPGKDQAMDALFSNQEKLLSLSQEIREKLNKFLP